MKSNDYIRFLERLKSIEDDVAEIMAMIIHHTDELRAILTSLGLRIEQKDIGMMAKVSVPLDPMTKCGFLSQLLRDVKMLKNKMMRLP